MHDRLLCFLLVLTASTAFGQTVPLGIESSRHIDPISSTARKQRFTYATKDLVPLGLDVYSTGDSLPTRKKPCLLFVFGGAFMAGRRDDSLYNNYFNSLLAHEYVVISISYRLGLKGVKNLSKFNIAPLEKAIGMAVDDVYDATDWLIDHAGQFGIDTAQIILSGSSSGAITVLEADFNRRNQKPVAKKLPADFNYAGIIAFSGAIFSVDGRPNFMTPPAPVLLFHGTADKMVPYEQIRFLNRGTFGSPSIARVFKENQIDLSIYDPAAKPLMVLTPKELFEKLQPPN